jgi:uncharacterized protein YndB with AHSA1/START domain
MSKSIRHEFFYTHPVEAVWEYLTQAELLAQWLMPNDFELKPGHEFQFTSKPKPQFNSDGIFHCKILEIVPLKKLSYSWKSGPGDGTITLDTLVVWTLLKKDNGTALQLEHSGFKEIENLGLYTGMTAGWLTNMQKIADRLNTIQDGTTKA